MRLAIMQPYFMPYIGYFSLIKHSDLFILFDDIQFIRHGWIERNRILKPNDSWQYIQVPLIKHSQKTSISDVLINNNLSWKDKILAQLQHYKKRAPFYSNVIKLLNEIFENDFNDIVHLNYASLLNISRYLDVSTPIEIYSQMGLSIEPVNAPDEWALNICRSYNNVAEYINPIGGASFFDKSKYEKYNISLLFQQMNLNFYDQHRDSFESGLSILDVMMFNSPNDINLMLDDFSLVEE